MALRSALPVLAYFFTSVVHAAITTQGAINTPYSVTLEKRYGVSLDNSVPFSDFHTKFVTDYSAYETWGCLEVATTLGGGNTLDISVNNISSLTNGAGSIQHQNTPAVEVKISDLSCVDANSKASHTFNTSTPAINILTSTGRVFLLWRYSAMDDPTNPMVSNLWTTGSYTGSVVFDVSEN